MVQVVKINIPKVWELTALFISQIDPALIYFMKASANMPFLDVYFDVKKHLIVKYGLGH